MAGDRVDASLQSHAVFVPGCNIDIANELPVRSAPYAA